MNIQDAALQFVKDNLPPIQLSEDKVLVNGFHRYAAYKLANITEVSFEYL